MQVSQVDNCHSAPRLFKATCCACKRCNVCKGCLKFWKCSSPTVLLRVRSLSLSIFLSETLSHIDLIEFDDDIMVYRLTLLFWEELATAVNPAVPALLQARQFLKWVLTHVQEGRPC